MHSVPIIWVFESWKADKNICIVPWWDKSLKRDCQSIIVSVLLHWGRRKIEEMKYPIFAHTSQQWPNNPILDITVLYIHRMLLLCLVHFFKSSSEENKKPFTQERLDENIQGIWSDGLRIWWVKLCTLTSYNWHPSFGHAPSKPMGQTLWFGRKGWEGH